MRFLKPIYYNTINEIKSYKDEVALFRRLSCDQTLFLSYSQKLKEVGLHHGYTIIYSNNHDKRKDNENSSNNQCGDSSTSSCLLFDGRNKQNRIKEAINLISESVSRNSRAASISVGYKG